MVDSTYRSQAPEGVRHIPVPPDVHALSTLARIDYENALAVDLGAAQGARARTAEQWARAVLEGAPADTQRALTRGWTALGLRLGPSARSEGRVLGWPVRHSTADTVLLGAGPTLGLHGELLFQRRKHTVLLATFIQLDDDGARTLWTGAESRHPLVQQQLLEQAVARAMGAPA
ncbi:hypothetical protein [Streptomyces sp. MST-110588]|uniref:hypothetical protein n=1 Tax=Streptomyces sp. MST-110588 TaxID=2833628 RepID=UPI001F5D53EE|nr:hypothetical protein [Streptomyces sp. MST-110588]UNO40007.1 hypothetical protein KGS77_10890 [Streptomyces sp. MST-110588]